MTDAINHPDTQAAISAAREFINRPADSTKGE